MVQGGVDAHARIRALRPDRILIPGPPWGHAPAQTGRLLVQVERLEQLIAELLDTSRIQQGRLALQPEPMDLRELAKEVEFRLLTRIAVLLIEQVPSEVEKNRAAAHVLKVLDGQINAFANDALVAGDRGADKVRGQMQHRVGAKVGSQTLKIDKGFNVERQRTKPRKVT